VHSATHKRPLTEQQVRACEKAKMPRCRCRCKGALHGGQRAFVELLPEGDPHHFAPAKPGARRESVR